MRGHAVFETVHVDLSDVRTEGNALEIRRRGTYLYVVDASSDSARAEITLDVQQIARLPIYLDRGYRWREEFARVWLTNTAQPDQWIKLVVCLDPGFTVVNNPGRSISSEGFPISQAPDTTFGPHREYDGDELGTTNPVLLPSGPCDIYVQNQGPTVCQVRIDSDGIGAYGGFKLEQHDTLVIPNYDGTALYVVGTSGEKVYIAIKHGR